MKSELRYPQKSHRKPVVVPSHSDALAEFFGIMIGDGGINNPWQVTITLNATADAKYATFVQNLMYELFGIAPARRVRASYGALVLSLSSTAVVEFLIQNGLCRGNKVRQSIRIPEWIFRERTYKIACVRGLVDTDGCMVLHSRAISGKTYSHVYVSFSSASAGLLAQVSEIWREFGLSPTLAPNGREVYLYRKKDVQLYVAVIGTSNPRIARIYKKWRDG